MIRVEKYGRRTFAVYEDDALLAVVCYRKGAEALRRRIEDLCHRIADLEGGIRRTRRARSAPAAFPTGAAPRDAAS